MTHLKDTGSSVCVKKTKTKTKTQKNPHLAMININSQEVLYKSAFPAADTVIRVGSRALVRPSPAWKSHRVAARLESSRLRLS